MKKLLTIAIVFLAIGFLPKNVDAQTKEETVKWMKSKLSEFPHLKSMHVKDSYLFLSTTTPYVGDTFEKCYKIDLSQVDTIRIPSSIEYHSYSDVAPRKLKVLSYFGNSVFERVLFVKKYMDLFERTFNDPSSIPNLIARIKMEQGDEFDKYDTTWRKKNDLRVDFSEANSYEIAERFGKALIHLAKLHGGCDPNKKNPEAF